VLENCGSSTRTHAAKPCINASKCGYKVGEGPLKIRPQAHTGLSAPVRDHRSRCYCHGAPSTFGGHCHRIDIDAFARRIDCI